nr:recombinase family protein [Arthrospira sp. PLM2.Bin9]
MAYARVSSRGQKADLDRQAEKLLEVHPNGELITDIASGLNFKRGTAIQTIR